MKKLIAIVSIATLSVILTMSVHNSLVYGAEVLEKSWSIEELRYKEATNNLKEIVTQIPTKLEKLLSSASEEGIKQGTVKLIISLLSNLKNTLDAGSEVDLKHLKDVKKAKESVSSGKEALKKALKKVIENRKKNLRLYRQAVCGAILEDEIISVYGKTAIPYAINSKFSNFHQMMRTTFGGIEKKLNIELEKLEAASEDYFEIETIIQNSLQFKKEMADSLSDFTESIVSLKDIGTFPSAEKMLQKSITDTKVFDDGIKMVGILMDKFLDVFFEGSNDIQGDFDFPAKNKDPDLRREKVKDMGIF